MLIHPLSVVHPTARLGNDVQIGPFCLVEAGAVLGDRCVLVSHVVVKQDTILGDDNYVYEGAVLGGPPQHAHMPPRVGGLTVGSGNTIREHVTLHRSMDPARTTRVGSRILMMAGVHVAHDCQIGNDTIFANNATLGGHVTVGERAFVSGNVAVHQHCRIGRFAMVGGLSHVVKDVPPYVTIDGASGFVVGLNAIGLRRGGFTHDEFLQLKTAYRLLYRSGLRWQEILTRLECDFAAGPAAEFFEFCRNTRRGIVPERRVPPVPSTLRMLDESSEMPRLRKAG